MPSPSQSLFPVYDFLSVKQRGSEFTGLGFERLGQFHVATRSSLAFMKESSSLVTPSSSKSNGMFPGIAIGEPTGLSGNSEPPMSVSIQSQTKS